MNISHISLIYIFTYSPVPLPSFSSGFCAIKNYFYGTGEMTLDNTALSPWKLSYFIITWVLEK